MSWEGWRVGMRGQTVKDTKAVLKRKFSYARNLDDGDYFSEKLQMVLAEYQRRKNAANNLGLREDGVLDWSTQVALGVINPNPPKAEPARAVILTAQGTGVDMWTGFPADLARAVSDLFYWQPIGYYPASPFPMRRSYRQGIDELVIQCRKHAGKPKVLAGFSQGAIVTSRVWRDEVASRNGRLWDLRDEFVGAVTWGNPDREQGVANGNRLSGIPIPEGSGITDHRMVGTPDWWMDFAHGANSDWGRDLYTDAPVGDAWEHMVAIWKIVENVSFMGANGLLEQVLEITQRPLTEIAAALQAITAAGMFFFARTGPHLNYDIAPAVQFVRRLAENL